MSLRPNCQSAQLLFFNLFFDKKLSRKDLSREKTIQAARSPRSASYIARTLFIQPFHSLSASYISSSTFASLLPFASFFHFNLSFHHVPHHSLHILPSALPLFPVLQPFALPPPNVPYSAPPILSSDPSTNDLCPDRNHRPSHRNRLHY